MQLAILRPRVKDGVLIMDCPCGGDHNLRVPIVPERANKNGCHWTMQGELPEVTITPSIDLEGHWHGTIEKGVVNTIL